VLNDEDRSGQGALEGSKVRWRFTSRAFDIPVPVHGRLTSSELRVHSTPNVSLQYIEM
jgi:hypothetical protein